MLTRAKVFGLTVVALLFLVLALGARTTAAPLSRKHMAALPLVEEESPQVTHVVGVSEDGYWTQRASMTTARSHPGVVGLNGRIYVFGGYNTSEALDSVEIYDPTTDAWTLGPPMPGAKSATIAVSVNGLIYVLGGDELVYCFDPVQETWSTKTAVPVSFSGGAAAVVFNGEIYLACNEQWMYCYDPTTDSWTAKTPVPAARSIESFAALNGKLYAIGGGEAAGEIHRIDVYDPVSDSWTIGGAASLGTRRTHLGSPTPVVNGKIYVIGGWNGYSAQTSVEEYDPTTNSWRYVAPLPMARYGIGYGVLGSRIYAIGGDYGGAGGHWQTRNDEFTVPSMPVPGLGVWMLGLPEWFKEDVVQYNEIVDSPERSITYIFPKIAQVSTLAPFTITGTYAISGTGSPAEYYEKYLTPTQWIISYTQAFPPEEGYLLYPMVDASGIENLNSSEAQTLAENLANALDDWGDDPRIAGWHLDLEGGGSLTFLENLATIVEHVDEEVEKPVSVALGKVYHRTNTSNTALVQATERIFDSTQFVVFMLYDLSCARFETPLCLLDNYEASCYKRRVSGPQEEFTSWLDPSVQENWYGMLGVPAVGTACEFEQYKNLAGEVVTETQSSMMDYLRIGLREGNEISSDSRYLGVSVWALKSEMPLWECVSFPQTMTLGTWEQLKVFGLTGWTPELDYIHSGSVSHDTSWTTTDSLPQSSFLELFFSWNNSSSSSFLWNASADACDLEIQITQPDGSPYGTYQITDSVQAISLGFAASGDWTFRVATTCTETQDFVLTIANTTWRLYLPFILRNH